MAKTKLVIWAWVERRGCKTVYHVCTNEEEIKKALERKEKDGVGVLYHKVLACKDPSPD